jgi:hypothetical protein
MVLKGYRNCYMDVDTEYIKYQFYELEVNARNSCQILSKETLSIYIYINDVTFSYIVI